MEKITIKDVARLAGVSVATVSYIINGKHEERYTEVTKLCVLHISEPTRVRPLWISG
ncbi:MAG: LacI family DNA-binding transcriptional regulator, partial [Clostridia bacterium]|nr:LacI family DNA-binding transcriptional regulator [Clostridia bacterium]